MKVKKIVAEFYKGYWRKDHSEGGGEKMGIVTMIEKRL